MNTYAYKLFQMLEGDIECHTKTILENIQKGGASAKMAESKRMALEAEIREDLEVLTWGYLGLFDNVGSRLPDGVLGYDILAKPAVFKGKQIAHGRRKNIRDGEDDYSDMWLSFRAASKTRAEKQTR